MRILAVEVKTQSHHPTIIRNKVYSFNSLWQVNLKLGPIHLLWIRRGGMRRAA